MSVWLLLIDGIRRPAPPSPRHRVSAGWPRPSPPSAHSGGERGTEGYKAAQGACAALGGCGGGGGGVALRVDGPHVRQLDGWDAPHAAFPARFYLPKVPRGRAGCCDQRGWVMHWIQGAGLEKETTIDLSAVHPQGLGTSECFSGSDIRCAVSYQDLKSLIQKAILTAPG